MRMRDKLLALQRDAFAAFNDRPIFDRAKKE
jgi:hypothetical protein